MLDHEARLEAIGKAEETKQVVHDYFAGRVKEWLSKWPDDERGPSHTKDLMTIMDNLLGQITDLHREILVLEDEVRTIGAKSSEKKKEPKERAVSNIAQVKKRQQNKRR